MAFRVKTLIPTLLLALSLSACGPAPVEPTPAQEPPPPAGNLYYVGSAADPLSKLLFDRLEDWAEEENWVYVSYDCRGVETTQAGQMADLAREEPPGVVVLYPTGDPSIQNEGVETLYRAGFSVITLNRESGTAAKRYVSCHIGLEEDDILPAAAKMVNSAVGRREAAYIRLSNYWPDPQAEDLEEALRSTYTLLDEGYTSGERAYGQLAVEEMIAQRAEAGVDGDTEDENGEEKSALPDFLFSMSQAAALGAVDAMERDSAWAEVPVFALQGDVTGAKEVAYGRLAGVVCLSPRELTQRLLDAIPQVAEGKRLPRQELTPTAVTSANAQELLEEYEN